MRVTAGGKRWQVYNYYRVLHVVENLLDSIDDIIDDIKITRWLKSQNLNTSAMECLGWV